MTIYILDVFFKKITLANDYFYLYYAPSFIDVTTFQIKFYNIEKYKFMWEDEQDFFVLFEDGNDTDIGKIDDYIIETDEQTNETTATFSGRLSKFILENRINEQRKTFRNSYSVDIIKDVVERCNELKDSYTYISGRENIIRGTEKILQKQIGFDTVYNIIYPLMQQDMIGVKFDFSIVPLKIYNGYIYGEEEEEIPYTNVDKVDIKIYTGKDRTEGNTKGNKRVVLRYDNGEIMPITYHKNNIDDVTFFLVAGEDVGEERRVVTEQIDILDKTVTQWNNRQIYVDARDIQSEVDGKKLSDEEYEELLLERGTEKELEKKGFRSYDCSYNEGFSTYRYGVDFFIGDKITIKDKRLGISMDVYVLTAEKTFDSGMWNIHFVFSDGKIKPFDIVNKIKRNESNIEIAINNIGV